MSINQPNPKETAENLVAYLRQLKNDRGAMATLRCALSPARLPRAWPLLARVGADVRGGGHAQQAIHGDPARGSAAVRVVAAGPLVPGRLAANRPGLHPGAGDVCADCCRAT